jgi:hypothetical protein
VYDLERRGAELAQAEWLTGDVDAVIARSRRIASRQRRVGATAMAAFVVLLAAGGLVLGRTRTSSGPAADPAPLPTLGQRQALDCATVLHSATSDRSIAATMAPGADPAAVNQVRDSLATAGMGELRVQSAEENLSTLRDVIGPDRDTSGLRASMVGASITGSLPPDSPPTEVDRVLGLARGQTGVTGATAGATPCRIDDAELRDLFDRYLRRRWRGGADTDAIVFFDPASTQAERDAVGDVLLADPAVRHLRSNSQDDAYAEFTCLFAGTPEMVASVDPSILPMSLWVDADEDAAAVTRVKAQVTGQPGVKEFVTPLTLADWNRVPMDADIYGRLVLPDGAATNCTRPGQPLK